MSETRDKNIRTIAVTGGSGRLGRYVVDALIDRYEVRVLDRQPPKQQQVAFRETDVLDYDAVKAGLEGVDAVIHLAAIDFDFAARTPPEAFIKTNTLGTWHVLQAAESQGVSRVVLCSSVSACGLSEANPDFGPDCLPVDETHARYPIQPYSVSKLIMEEMGESFARRGTLDVLCLRPMMVLVPDNVAPTLERADDLSTRWLFYYVTPEDCARAFRCAVEAGNVRFGVFFITAADSCRAEPTLDWYRRAWGRLPEIRDPDYFRLDPRASIFDGRKARELLGFVPESDWLRIAGTGPRGG